MISTQKRFSINILLPVIAIMFIAGGCAHIGNGKKDVEGDSSVADITEEAHHWADSVINTLSIEQRAAQCLMPAVYARADAATIKQIKEYADSMSVGGIMLLKGSNTEAKALSDTLQSAAGIPALVAIDAEWGLAMRLEGGKRYPKNGPLGADKDVTDVSMYDYGAALAEECRETGINMVLGPVLDVSDKDGYIGERSFGSDARRVASLGVSYAKGLEAGGIISVAKHFPGHGSATDSHKSLPYITKTRNQLTVVDLLPFREYIKEQLPAVMVGHLAVPALGDTVPSAVSKRLITDILRREMGFKGLVLTDALSMTGARGHTASEAIAAGADIVVAPERVADSIGDIVSAVKEGRVSEQQLNESVKRILFYKYLYLL